ncbi:unnamed protein product [Closterium sp. NIES-64]|nr:unnamed protein product [Closterium sp. NIES-64]
MSVFPRPAGNSVGRSEGTVPSRTEFPSFPYDKPYEIQLQLMRAVYAAVEHGQVGIMESPTGTGKTLSLICSVLQWLLDEHERQAQSAAGNQAEQPPSAGKGCEDGSNSGDREDRGDCKASEDCEPDWLRDYEGVKEREAAARVCAQRQQRLEHRRREREAASADVLGPGGIRWQHVQVQGSGEDSQGRWGRRSFGGAIANGDLMNGRGVVGKGSGRKEGDMEPEQGIGGCGREEEEEEEQFLVPEWESDDDDGGGAAAAAGRTGHGRKKRARGKGASGASDSSSDEESGGGAAAAAARMAGTRAAEALAEESLKVFFCSRTHSQLSQFITELRRTPFADQLFTVSLASRKNLCINQSVLKLGNASAISERCLELQRLAAERKSKTSKQGERDQASKDRTRASASASTCGCPYWGKAQRQQQFRLLHPAQRQQQFLQHLVAAPPADIEDLGRLGSRLSARQVHLVQAQLAGYLERFRHKLGAGNRRYVLQLQVVARGIGAVIASAKQPRMQGIDKFLFSLAVDNINLFKRHRRVPLLPGGGQHQPLQSVLILLPLPPACARPIRPFPFFSLSPSHTPPGMQGIDEFLFSLAVDNINLFKLHHYVQASNIAHKVMGVQSMMSSGFDPFRECVSSFETSKKPHHYVRAHQVIKPARLKTIPTPSPPSDSHPVSFSLLPVSSPNVSRPSQHSIGVSAFRAFAEFFSSLCSANADGRVLLSPAPTPNHPTNHSKHSCNSSFRGKNTGAKEREGGSGSGVGVGTEEGEQGKEDGGGGFVKFVMLNTAQHMEEVRGAMGTERKWKGQGDKGTVRGRGGGREGEWRERGGGGQGRARRACELLVSARAIILAGGTLQPLDTMLDQLFPSLPPVSSVHPFSPPLPISPQLLVSARAIILAGGTLQPLDTMLDQLFPSLPPAIILAGGTLQPLDTMLDQLFPSLPPARLRLFSCGHIVPGESVLPLAVAKGPSGKNLDFTFQSRSDPAMIAELGRLLVNVCSVAPGGIVVFFPSFAYLQEVLSAWQAGAAGGAVLPMLEARKGGVFIEPRGAAEVEAVLGQYRRCIQERGVQEKGGGQGRGVQGKDSQESGQGGVGTSGGDLQAANRVSPRGAVLLCVMGGKMSEGINFSDDMGRAVVVVGQPFPSPSDLELNERIRFIDRLAGSSSRSVGPGDAGDDGAAAAGVDGGAAAAGVSGGAIGNSTSGAGTRPSDTGSQDRTASLGDSSVGEGAVALAAAMRSCGSKGRQLYEDICAKAVNQSIGRAIRHRGDYAAILLVDARYAHADGKGIAGKLPSWIKAQLVVCNGSFGEVPRRLRQFFRHNEEFGKGK